MLSIEKKKSQAKLAKLVQAFNADLDDHVIETILQTEGDINYAIPFSDHLKIINHTLQSGTILHQMNSLARNRLSKVFNLLLSHGADITIKNSEGQTVLHSEINNNDRHNWDSQLINAVLTAQVTQSIRENLRDNNGITHFHAACIVDHVSAVNFFLKNGVPVDLAVDASSPIFPGYSALHVAAECSAMKTAELLLKCGANVYCKNADGLTPMSLLIKAKVAMAHSKLQFDKDQQMIHLLLTSCNVNNNNNNDDGAHIVTDECGFSTFHAACTISDISFAKKLLDHVNDVNHSINVDSSFCPGYSALHFAAYFNIDLLKLLMKKGGKIMAKDADGVTPLDICLERHNIRDICSIISSQPAWKDIMLSDNKTTLLDLISSMENNTKFETFLGQIEDANVSVVKNSPLWPGRTLLHFAVMFSERINVSSSKRDTIQVTLKLIDQCLDKGADVTIQDSFGTTPLHLAFDSRKSTAIKTLLMGHTKTVSPVDKNNVSHLHIACTKDTGVLLDKLIVDGADVNLHIRATVECYKKKFGSFVMPAGSTPLHFAVASRKVSNIKSLLKHGADPNAADDQGWSPVHRLILLKDLESIGKALLSSSKLKERVIAEIGLSHLHVACLARSLTAVKKLLKLRSDVNSAVRREPLPESKSGWQTNYTGCTPLHLAAQQGSVKIANVLLEAGADILSRNDKGMSPLYQALTNNDLDLIELFVAKLEANDNLQKRLKEDKGMTLLHIFAFNMNDCAVKKLIDSGFDVNSKVQSDCPIWSGCTPLHTWVYGTMNFHYGNYALVMDTLHLLLDSGADVTLFNAVLDTPLHSFNYSTATVNDAEALSIGRLMLQSQKDFGVNPVNAYGTSHFHVAVRFYDVIVAEEFIKRGVDVNQSVDVSSDDKRNVKTAGCTPLHFAMYAQSRYLESLPDRIQMIDLLLRCGADVYAQDVLGNTPLHALAYNGYSSRETILRKIIGIDGIVNVTNNNGETPFTALLKSSRVVPKEIMIFLDQGCRVNVYDSTSQNGFLTLFCRNHSNTHLNQIYRTLFKSPDIKSIDDTGRTAIHNIVSTNYKYFPYEIYDQVIKRLVKLGCDVDAQDKSGKTALHTAVQFKNVRAIEILLMSGADINIVDRKGMSAFSYSQEAHRNDNSRNDSILHMNETISMHLEILTLLKLDVSEQNENLMEKAPKILKLDSSYFRLFNKELATTKVIKVVESDAMTLYDLLSETGAVSAYSFMPLLKRRAVDKFFKTKNKQLDNFYHVRGLLKMQYKKAAKRATLIGLANDSLKTLTGFPLPEPCCRSVLRCLGLADVQSLIASVQKR